MGAVKVYNAATGQTEYVGGLVTLDLVARSAKPYYAAHRGGALRYPENTMLALRAAAEAGFWLEVDVQPSNDGVLVGNHDATVDRTMYPTTGNVIDLSVATLRGQRVAAPVPGALTSTPALWAQVLNEFGGRTVIMPEIKGSNWTLGQRTDFYNDILARGLRGSVIVQSFTYSHVLEAIAKGLRGMALGTGQTAAQMAADKVWGVGVPTGTSSTYISQCRALNIEVFVYTVTNPTERAAAFSAGATGVFDNDPWQINAAPSLASMGGSVLTGAWSGEQVPWPGMVGNPRLSALTNPRGVFSGPGKWTAGFTPSEYGSGLATLGVPLSFLGARPAPMAVRIPVHYRDLSQTQARWSSLFWGRMDPYVGFNDDGVETFPRGYHFLYRRNGDIVLFRVDPGATAVSIAASGTFAAAPTLSGPEIPAGSQASVIMELEVNATQVIGRIITSAPRGQTSTYTITATDNTYRDAASYVQISSNGLYSDFDLAGLVARSL